MTTMPTFALCLLMLTAPQEDAAEMKWAFTQDDLFDLKYSFAEQRRGESGAGEARSLFETNDKRDVEAELSYKEDNVLALKLKKVSWVYGTQEYDINLAFSDGKPIQVTLRLKIDPKSLTYAGAKAQGEALLDQFKRLNEGVYVVNTASRGETLFLRTGSATSGRLGLFERIFTHPMLPQGSVKKDQTWKEPLEAAMLPPGTLEAKPVLEHKVTSVTAKDLTAKAGIQIPISKPPSPGSTMSTTGTFTYAREWTFSRADHLAASKEEITYVRKTDAKGKEADFYKSNNSHKLTQTLKITKRPPVEKKE